jgi:hypothetical protein
MNAKPQTDTALWAIRPVFGTAGGADEIVLTEEGLLLAFSVGAQVRRGGPAEAMMALDVDGGSVRLSARSGSEMLLTDMGRRHNMTVWVVLMDLGYCERWYDESGDGVRLTSVGADAVSRGHLEQTHLLSRCRRSASVG